MHARQSPGLHVVLKHLYHHCPSNCLGSCLQNRHCGHGRHLIHGRQETVITRIVTSMSTTKARFQTAATPGCSNCTVDTMWCMVALTPLRDSVVVLSALALVVSLLSGVPEDAAAGLTSKEGEAEAVAVAVLPALLAPTKQSKLLDKT